MTAPMASPAALSLPPRCLDATGRPKAAYASEAAAHRALARSAKWRRRAEWPCAFKCPECHAWHLAHPQWVR